ncbi:hypothetical protein PWR63_32340 [Paraburkholderia sp. A2WS-5]
MTEVNSVQFLNGLGGAILLCIVGDRTRERHDTAIRRNVHIVRVEISSAEQRRSRSGGDDRVVRL